jgi:transglutaminase-like putative cysteine protease
MMDKYLQASQIIDWQDPSILDLANTIKLEHQTIEKIAKACFEWVRDEVRHSVDYQMNPVTCVASDVLKYKTGYCYAKSHLLAALLRANNIPAGFCYQRLSINDRITSFCLHGLNAIYLPKFGWYRVDSRGNHQGVDAQFTPPNEQLAFNINLPDEADFPNIFPEPLPIVIEALQAYNSWDELFHHLPDLAPEAWEYPN